MKTKLLAIALVLTSALYPLATLGATKQFQVDTGGTLTTSLVSYYKMEGSSNDFWSTNNGTDTSVIYGSSYGKVNQGVNFAGAGAIKENAVTSGNFSYSFWVNFASMPSSGQYYAFWTAGVNGGSRTQFFGVYTIAGTYQIVSILTGTLASFINDATLPWNVWTHIVITYDGTNVKWYKNGSLYQTIAYSGGYGTTSITVLGSQGNPAIYTGETQVFGYNGSMDEAGIWSKALSTTEITDLYNSGNGQTMILFTPTTCRIRQIGLCH